MLTVALHLLTGRYGATQFNDRSQPEWPPHPARLFSALVATWADAGEPDPEERAALVWLERQPPPELVCSGWRDVACRNAVIVYVPGNDPTVLKSAVDSKYDAVVAASEAMATAGGSKADKSLHRAEAAYRDAVRAATTVTGTESPSIVGSVLKILPENRNRQPRTFPSVTPPDPLVHFVWPSASPSESQRRSLDGLLARVGRLGHSASLVSCNLAAQPPGKATLVPRVDGDHVLRVPRSGLLDRLEVEFGRHRGTNPRVLPSAMTGYGRPEPVRPAAQAGIVAGGWLLLELPVRDPESRQLRALRNTRSLDLARAVREALLAHAGHEAGIVSGLWPDGRHHPHLAVVPLASVGHRWADGTIRGVALMLPATITPAERATVERGVAAWRADGLLAQLPGAAGELAIQFRRAPFIPEELSIQSGSEWSDQPVALRRSTWCQPARHWVSASPIALDRTVPGLHAWREGAEQAVQESIARSCVRVGLPEPAEVVVATAGMTAGVPAAPGRGSRGGRAFPRFVAAGTGQHKQCIHVSLTFAEPVRGPVLIGSGRYLGYGLFLPIRENRS